MISVHWASTLIADNSSTAFQRYVRERSYEKHGSEPCDLCLYVCDNHIHPSELYSCKYPHSASSANVKLIKISGTVGIACLKHHRRRRELLAICRCDWADLCHHTSTDICSLRSCGLAFHIAGHLVCLSAEDTESPEFLETECCGSEDKRCRTRYPAPGGSSGAMMLQERHAQTE